MFRLNCWENVDGHILQAKIRPVDVDFADERSFDFFLSSEGRGVRGSELTGEVGRLVGGATALGNLQSLATPNSGLMLCSALTVASISRGLGMGDVAAISEAERRAVDEEAAL